MNKRGHRQPGSTALELFVLLSVVSLVGIVAIPSYLSYRTNSQANTLARQFRHFTAVFQQYADSEGAWPGDEAAGHIPLGLERQLPEFDKPSLIGGNWDWDYPSAQGEASLCLVNPRGSAEFFRRLDQILDDGNISSGALVFRDSRLTLTLETLVAQK